MTDPIQALASHYSRVAAAKNGTYASPTSSSHGRVTAAANNNSTNSTSSSSSSSNASDALDQNEFMQLLLAEMQNQDPLDPMDGTAFFNQLAQLSLLEQMYTLNTTMSTDQQQQQIANASDLLGRTVSATGSDGSAVSGTVQGLTISDGNVSLDINGTNVSLSDVTSVTE
jgi:flagellar basal-body rod modification protein FlgD